ncbi:serine/threonine protein kinase, CMGC [Blastocladiella emersonii ATCC 22665]|nr:serine/threonine protein kinase, CMGC [Blastocladiella emersonii ATCC 22665]
MSSQAAIQRAKDAAKKKGIAASKPAKNDVRPASDPSSGGKKANGGAAPSKQHNDSDVTLAGLSGAAGADEEYSEGTAYSDEEEDAEDYCEGGYHPVAIGDAFKQGRYTVLRKLGWGHFSTVWLCRDNAQYRYVALKIVKSAPHYTETALDEIQLLQRVVAADPTHPGRKFVVELYDNFMHTGPHGKHVCMVFEVLGENLLSLIRRYRHQGIPAHLVKQIAAQVLCGLDYLHSKCAIIHTDLKPENVLVVVDVDQVARDLGLESESSMKSRLLERSLSDVTLAEADAASESLAAAAAATAAAAAAGAPPAPLPASPASTATPSFPPTLPTASGSSPLVSSVQASPTPVAPPRSSSPPGSLTTAAAAAHAGDALSKSATAEGEQDPATQTPPRPVERKRSYAARSTSGFIDVKIADLGNACWVDHHFTNDIQTRQYRCPEVILGAPWGASADMWSMGCMLFELITGDYMFDPQAGERFTKDDDHIAQIIELIGPFPRHLALRGKYSNELFTRRGELRNIHRLKMWPLPAVLYDKYHFSKADAETLASFLLPMIDIDPERRIGPAASFKHRYLDGFRTGERECDQPDAAGAGPGSGEADDDVVKVPGNKI